MGINLGFAQVSPPAVIFNGTYGKFLPADGLKFKNDITVTSGALDPTVTAFSAPPGSLYISTSTGLLYQKQDSGSSTNWTPFFYGPIFSNDNRIVRTDGTDGLQESGITLDDSDSISGVFDLTATGDISAGTVTGSTSVDGGNLQLSGNDIVSTDTDGNIALTPNGTGEVVASTLEVSDLTDNAIIIPDGANGLVSTGVTINGTDDISGARNITGTGQIAGATLDVGSTTAVDSILDEDDLSSDSATALATQQSIKAYVDAQIGGSGDVSGPASSTDSAFALFDGTTGKLIKDSATTISIDDTLASDSDSLIPTEQAVKGYVDTTASTLVTGPGPSTTDGQVAVFNGTGGYTIKGVPVAIDASGNMTGVADLTASGAIQGATVEGTTSVTGGNTTVSDNEISTSTGGLNFASSDGSLTKTDANANTVTLGSNNPELSNRMSYPSFEEAITSVTISGGTGSPETTETFDGSQSLEWALSAETGTATTTVADTRLGGVQIEASCYVSAHTSVTGLQFKAQKDGSDVPGLVVDIPGRATCSIPTFVTRASCEANSETWYPNFTLIGIPFIGGSTSSGFQIEATATTTDSVFIDSCSVGTQRRVSDFASVTGAEVLVRGQGNGGEAITAGTTDIPFVETHDPLGLWDGDSFTIPSNGIYTICARVFYTDSNNRILGLYKDGSAYRNLSDLQSSAFEAVPLQCYTDEFESGTLSIRELSVSGTLSNNTVNHWITISRTKSIEAVSLPLDNFTGLTKGKAYSIPSSAGFGTIDTANTYLEWRRVADKMVIDGFITPGTTTGTTANIGLPTGYTIATNAPRLGGYWFTSASSNTHGGAILITDGDTFIEFSTNGVFGGDPVSPTSAANGDQIVGTGVKFHIHAEIPIEGWDAGSAILQVIRPEVCVLTDQKGSGNAGGSGSAATWNPRVLNTTTGDCDWVSLSNGTTGTDGTANYWTLNPGNYHVSCTAPAYAASLHQLRVLQDPGGTPGTAFNGSGLYARSASDASTNAAEAEGYLTVTSTTTYQLQHYTEVATGGASLLGLAVSSGANQYFGRCAITKLQ